MSDHPSSSSSEALLSSSAQVLFLCPESFSEHLVEMKGRAGARDSLKRLPKRTVGLQLLTAPAASRCVPVKPGLTGGVVLDGQRE